MSEAKNDRRKRVAVLYGGRSVEHAISIITALEVLDALDASRYVGVPVYVDPAGRWWTGEALLDPRFYVGKPQATAKLTEVALLPVPGVGGLTVRDAARGLFKRGPELVPVDVYLPVFHGTHGEDGCVQGLFELADVPYTGSDLLASALGMNKWTAKTIVKAAGVPVLPAALVERREFNRDLAATRARILAAPELASFPLIVKPCSLGSSVGVSKAGDAAELDAGLDRAFKYDTRAIVEPFVGAKRELNVAVSDAGGDGEPRASVSEEPVAEELLDYQRKYLSGGAKKAGDGRAGMSSAKRRIDPPDFPPSVKQSAAEIAVRAFSALGCSGDARIDFIYDAAHEALWFNEINTLPGSLAYYLWAESKPPLLYTALLNGMIERAVARKGERDRNERQFGFDALVPLIERRAKS